MKKRWRWLWLYGPTATAASKQTVYLERPISDAEAAERNLQPLHNGKPHHVAVYS